MFSSIRRGLHHLCVGAVNPLFIVGSANRLQSALFQLSFKEIPLAISPVATVLAIKRLSFCGIGSQARLRYALTS